MLKLFNTLSRTVEEFRPLNPPKVGMYCCGPTVYDFMHIGNLRTFVFADILRRTLELDSYKVKFIQNITDIEDKIIKKATEKNISISDLTKEYTDYFFQDLASLNIKPADTYPKATEHIQEMIKFIEELIKKGIAYKEEDGSIYFDISKFPDYGKLSQLETRELKTGTRILSDEYDKENVQDFALWKSVKPEEFGYDSPWGKGRPGWHIECSVMSQQYLGDTFDIHAGGIDLMFPHHENEIAQSEAKTGQRFVKYFIHGEHLLVDGKKMSKSLNNYYTLRDIKEKGFDPLALRYLFLTAHYRDKLNFTWESLQATQNALTNLREQVRNWEKPDVIPANAGIQIDNSSSELDPRLRGDDEPYYKRFLEALDNDLNTAQALAVVWELVKSDLLESEKAETLLKMDQVLGLRLEDYIGKKLEVPVTIMDLMEKREEARKSGDYTESDKLRKEIADLGYEIEDTSNGPKVKKS